MGYLTITISPTIISKTQTVEERKIFPYSRHVFSTRFYSNPWAAESDDKKSIIQTSEMFCLAPNVDDNRKHWKEIFNWRHLKLWEDSKLTKITSFFFRRIFFPDENVHEFVPTFFFGLLIGVESDGCVPYCRSLFHLRYELFGVEIRYLSIFTVIHIGAFSRHFRSVS